MSPKGSGTNSRSGGDADSCEGPNSNAKSKSRVSGKMNMDKIEPTDPKIKEAYDDFKADVTKRAVVILREIIPQKILYFNSLVNVNSDLGSVLHATDLDKTSYRYTSAGLAAANGLEEAVPVAKKVKMDDDKFIYKHTVPSHKQISEELAKLKVETSEVIELVGNVKLWIQLNVPRIEDGNNFGVGIQEDAIQELARVEDNAFNLYDTVCKYYMARAKLSTKIVKYPNVQDYQEAVRELDEKEWIHIKMTKVDMRNNYSMIYDLLTKNWEKVVKPKNEHGSSMMTF